ncbi:glycosyltransferase family 2 protein [Flavobacterium capsici]|uniref:Glycosyltransferase family A protein n=1 Tax=Flavobacterium capsici TaxID=3075618 RepID=A0AA96J3H5_9FLAO|nr:MULTISPECIES: glycosyltransferase family A protein [unclassified Flavobacterium]WNM20265.1 glycosyltransferase family A protein [Flavobacterium sp. PMR2A8]WNM21655.1 glycosyltransferase family A protein [Flavobacterium sp. PMTSA4]
MIILYHNKSKIISIVSKVEIDSSNEINKNIISVLLDFADRFDDEIIVWCHENERENLNIDEVESLFHHKKLLLSYDYSENNYFDRRLGYVEDSNFVNVKKKIKYPTWLMSSKVGAIHTSVLKACKINLKEETNFDYFLNSFAKRAMQFGLLCYSEPKLLKKISKLNLTKEASLSELFKFTKQHYKMRWIFLLFLNIFLFEKKVPLYPFLQSLFYRQRSFNPDNLNKILINSNKKIIDVGTIDVLIPTIGRDEYLLNVLNNLSSQTYLPKNVIIIEQNPEKNGVSSLDFLKNKSWPFQIKHHFTNQTGACNARNIGLQYVESEFTFFADDDIVFENDLIEKAMLSLQETGNEIILVACLLKEQPLQVQEAKQFNYFGAGHAFVKSSCFTDLKFNTAYEFGFGEDDDFGMQMRYKGYDILYISTSRITHLKAPIGGFRTKPILKWHSDIIQPKPSPTVMLFRLLYNTKEQINSYKVTLFFKNLNGQFLKNPFGYIKLFSEKWNRSLFWANELNR